MSYSLIPCLEYQQKYNKNTVAFDFFFSQINISCISNVIQINVYNFQILDNIEMLHVNNHAYNQIPIIM